MGRHGQRGSLRSGRRGCHFCSRLWPLCVSVRRPSPFMASLSGRFLLLSLFWSSLTKFGNTCRHLTATWCVIFTLVSSGLMFLNRALNCTDLLAMIRSFDRALLLTQNTASPAVTLRLKAILWRYFFDDELYPLYTQLCCRCSSAMIVTVYRVFVHPARRQDCASTHSSLCFSPAGSSATSRLEPS